MIEDGRTQIQELKLANEAGVLPGENAESSDIFWSLDDICLQN